MRHAFFVLLLFLSAVAFPAAGQSGEELEVLINDLRRMRNHSGQFLPSLQPIKRANLAREILMRDSTIALAHLVLGEQAERISILRRNFISIHGDFIFESNDSYSSHSDVSTGAHELGNMRDLVEKRYRFDVERLLSLGITTLAGSGRSEVAYYKAEGHLMRAYNYNRELQPIYESLARLLIASNQDKNLLPILHSFRTHFPENVAPYLYSGLVHYNLGKIEKSSYFFDIARSRMSDSLRAVFVNFSYMLSKRQKSLYKRNPELFSRRFWAANDVRMLTSTNERQLEHYARMTYAHLFFGNELGANYGWNTERGEVYIRYGAPKTYYQLRIDGTLMGNSRSAIWQYEDFHLVFSNTAFGEHPRYILFSPSAKTLSNPHVNAWANDYVLKAHAQFRKQPSVSTYEAPGQRSRIPFLVSSFTSNVGSVIYVPFGVRLTGKPQPGKCFDRSMQSGSFLIDEGYGIVGQDRDNIASLCSDRMSVFDEGAVWIGVHTLTAPPGSHKLSVEFATEGDISVGFEQIRLTVPDYSIDKLLLSDILLAYHIEEHYGEKPLETPGRILRNGLSITPAPWGVFDSEQPVYLYFEVYNLLPQAGRAHFEIRATLTTHEEDSLLENVIETIFGGGENASVAVEFEATGSTADDGQYLIMNASNQPPGEYVLLLRVRDEVSGQTATAKRIIVLE